MINTGMGIAAVFVALLTIVLSPLHAQEPTADQQKLSSLYIPIEGLLVGGQPEKSDLRKIKELGFNTIISLRPKTEEEEEVGYDEETEADKLGFDFIRIPITDAIDLNSKNLSALNKALEQAEGGAFLHCRTGNRVGAMLALRAYRMQQRSYAEAMALGKNSGMTWLSESVAKIMQDPESLSALTGEEKAIPQ